MVIEQQRFQRNIAPEIRLVAEGAPTRLGIKIVEMIEAHDWNIRGTRLHDSWLCGCFHFDLLLLGSSRALNRATG